MGLETNVKLFELLYNKEPNELLTYEDFKNVGLSSMVWIEYLTFVEKVKACTLLYENFQSEKTYSTVLYDLYKKYFIEMITIEFMDDDNTYFLDGIRSIKYMATTTEIDEKTELIIKKSSKIFRCSPLSLPYQVLPEILDTAENFRIHYEFCLRNILHELFDDTYDNSVICTYNEDDPNYYDVSYAMSVDDIHNIDDYRNFVDELSTFKRLKKQLEQKLIEKGINPFHNDRFNLDKSRDNAYYFEETGYNNFDSYVNLQEYADELYSIMPFIFKYSDLLNTIDNMEFDLENNSSIKCYVTMNFKPESILKLNGYSVSETDGLTDTQRRQILNDLIDKEIVDKDEVIQYLKSFINFNGKKLGNSRAVNKWKSDILFLNNYYS